MAAAEAGGERGGCEGTEGKMGSSSANSSMKMQCQSGLAEDAQLRSCPGPFGLFMTIVTTAVV